MAVTMSGEDVQDLVAEARKAFAGGPSRVVPRIDVDPAGAAWAGAAIRRALDEYRSLSWRSGGVVAWVTKSKALEYKICDLLGGKLPGRPPRRMPSVKSIARYWDLPMHECWRCGKPESPLERAHIVDRMEWDNGAGLDDVHNLSLLCHGCHRRMPIIQPEDWRKGKRYVGLPAPADYIKIEWRR